MQYDPRIVNPNYIDPNQPGEYAAGDLVSFPASVQQKLDYAKTLLSRGQTEQALPVLHQAGIELARSSPELFALVLATQIGQNELAYSESEENTETTETYRTVLGIRYGTDVKTVTRTRAHERSLGFRSRR